MNINELKFHGCTAWFDDHGNIVYGIFEKRKESSIGLTADMIIGSPTGLKMVKALRDSSSGEQRKKCEQLLQDVADLSRKRQREAKFTKYVRNPYERVRQWCAHHGAVIAAAGVVIAIIALI